jgi:hypothetical protein
LKTQSEHVEPSPAAARIAVLVMFFINGGLFAHWVSRIPEFQDRFGFDEGALGLTLLGISAGVLTALAVASGLIARFGSRTVTVAAAIADCLSLALIALMPHPSRCG